MNQNKVSICRTGITLLFVVFLLALSTNAMASTTIYFEAEGLSDVAAFQFSVLDSSGTLASDFNPSLPSDWDVLISTDQMTFTSFSQGSSLATGIVGSFDNDVILGEWVLGDQNGNAFIFGQDFTVEPIEGDYAVKAVPIPSAILLFGGGLMGLLGTRRKFKK